MVRVLPLTLLLTSALSVLALPKIERRGRYLYRSDDQSRSYIKGIAYQPVGTVSVGTEHDFPEPTDFVDPLANTAGCQRDLPYLRDLGVNTLRVYSVDAALNHDACVQALDAAGIYLFIDLSLPVNGSIDRVSPSWTTNLLDLYIKTIDKFLPYPNVLGFTIGNEIVNGSDATVAAPFIKAAARDTKAYLKSKGSSALVGYAAVDGSRDWLVPLARYLSCGSDETSIDLYGLNNYEWCGDSNVNGGYAALARTFADYNIPAYFSEFGCNTRPPRLWTEVDAIYGDVMSPVFSGGMAFSYFPATVPGFNLVEISADNSTVTTNEDYTRLATHFNAVTFINTPAFASAGASSYPTCPTPDTAFLASATLPPTPNKNVCSCLEQKSFSCQFDSSRPIQEVVGPLLGDVCGRLSQGGASCDVIAGNGRTGVYGNLGYCDPTAKLSWAFSAFYELNNRNPETCSFAGNATVNPSGPASSAAASAAASSCLANAPSGTFVPTAPSGSTNGNNGGSNTPGGNNNSGALINVVSFWIAALGAAVAGAVMTL